MKDSDVSTAPVFVVGSPRSGTTLLYHLLLSAGGFAKYYAEASVFNLLAPRFGDLSVARHRDALLDTWLASEFFRRSGLDADAFRAAVEADCRSAGDLLRLLMDGVSRMQGVSRWAECTPDNLLYVPAIREAFPEACFLHIVRDGRDVACSMAEQGWVGRHRRADFPTRALHGGLYWDWMLSRGRVHLAEPGVRAMEVRFEALVGRPAETLSAIGDFIQHDLSYSTICANQVGTVTRPNTSFPDEIGFNPVGRWRQRLDAKAAARLEAAIGDSLVHLGYELCSSTAIRQRESAAVGRARRLARWRFSSRHFLKTRTPLGRVFTNPALLTDFQAFDRERLMPQRKLTA
jgi:LPS sulfotransferase NodH